MEFVKNVEWIHVSRENFDSLPEESAIYVLVAQTKNNSQIVFYSGQTTNIKQRSKDHWGNDEANPMIKNIIKKCGKYISLYYAVVHGNSLDGHEKFLFKYFEPQAQNRAPEVEPKPVCLDQRFTKGKIAIEYFNI